MTETYKHRPQDQRLEDPWDSTIDWLKDLYNGKPPADYHYAIDAAINFAEAMSWDNHDAPDNVETSVCGSILFFWDLGNALALSIEIVDRYSMDYTIFLRGEAVHQGVWKMEEPIGA